MTMEGQGCFGSLLASFGPSKSQRDDVSLDSNQDLRPVSQLSLRERKVLGGTYIEVDQVSQRGRGEVEKDSMIPWPAGSVG